MDKQPLGLTAHNLGWPNDTWVTICTVNVNRADVDGGIEGLRFSADSDDWGTDPFGGNFMGTSWTSGGMVIAGGIETVNLFNKTLQVLIAEGKIKQIFADDNLTQINADQAARDIIDKANNFILNSLSDY